MNLLLNFPGKEPVMLSLNSYCKENLNQLRTYCSKAVRVEMFYILTTFFSGGEGKGKGKIKSHYWKI